jgi:pyruvate/2-oxoacid:ferredoxin oxidoreductase alpha subunit
MFYRHRQAIQAAMDEVPGLLAEADRAWHERVGRGWGVIERYRCDGAATVIVTMGSMAGTAREAVDAMRDAGDTVGLAKLRLFRPLPVAALRAALAGARDVVVLDRNHSPGAGGILHQELRAALYGMDDAPRVHGLLCGVGGVNVPPRKIVEFVNDARARAPGPASVWVR